MTFQPGESGNPAGRPRGARNKRTLAAESMFDRDSAKIIETLIELAKGGDIAAIRLCLDRICPKQSERPLSIELPPMKTQADAVAVMAAIVQAIGDGDLGAGEAAALGKVVASFSQTIVNAVTEQQLEQAQRAIELLKRK